MVQPLIDGRKAGESSPSQPVIAPDSARSVTLLKQVVGLSEGEIEGFGRDDIKLDGTPLSALSPYIICDYRFGTNNQEYINGVDEVANEIGVGVELSGSMDWVKLITNSDIDHIGIRLRWGPLQTSHTNGDVSGVSIKYDIYIATVGGSSELVLSTTLSDKTSDSYERYHEFKLPESDNGWIVRVVRVTPSASSSLVSDKMYVQAYSEIIKSKFTFPYTSLVYLEYDAKTFSNIAKLAVNAKGLIIKVPSNYDPVTRQYSGLWTGTFKMAYSNNPAWVYYDLVTNPRYGCGDRIDQSMVDKWSLYRLAQYCDQMVDDGYGGLEPRFTCNIYLQSKERAYDILNRLTGLFRAINFWNGTQIVVDADIPQDTSYLYTNANVVDGLFEYAGTAATDLYSAAKVAWDNPANGYNTEYEAVSYEHLVKKLGFKVLELDAWGCTSRGQALRAGRWALLAETDTVTFKVGMDGYLVMPGKVIEIQDEFYAGKSNGGRVISVSASGLEVTLDRPVETIAGDTISFNTTTGTVKKYNIASSADSVVTLSEAVDASVERMHIWAISSSQLATQKYRILTVKYDGIGEFTISAVEYNASKYEEIDSNILFDEPPTSIINPIAQDAVQNVVIDPHEFIYQGLNTVNLTIKWERAVNAVEYLVEVKKDDGSWLKLPATGNNSIELENVYAGTYIARVTAVSAFELKSLPTYSVKTVIHGKLTAPQPPLNLRLVPVLFGIECYWDFPANSSDVAVSRIAISYVDPTGLVDESSFVTYDKAYSDNKLVIQHLDLSTRVWFKVKLVDKLGFESPYTAWVNGQPSQDFDKVLDLISGHISEGALDQALQGKIDSASNLANDAQNLATQAKTVADNATIKAQEAADAVTQEAIDRAAALQAGISQVTTHYIAADSVIYGELNAYKASNDSAVATVVQKAESAVATGVTNSQSITELTGQVQVINNTKLDASVISNYYTKGQADDKSAEIAAGKIESYDANLVIGGTNLYTGPNPIPMVGQTSEGTHNATSAYSGITQLYHYLENSWFDLQDVAIGDDVITSLEIMVPSGSVVGEHSIYIGAYRFGNNWYIQSARKPLKEFPRDKWVKVAVPAGKFVDTGLTTPDGINISIWLSSCDIGTSFKWRNLMMEKGTKASAFSVSDKTLQFDINANANAIQTTNAEVSRINGEVVSTANSVNTLTSSVGLLQGSINEVRQTVTNNQESTNTLVTSLKSGIVDADDVSMMMRNAAVILEDLSFKNGWNGVQVYNNHGNGALVANFTDKLPDNPVASTRQIEFIHSGGATNPELGGYYQAVQSRANGVFLIKFVAKLPVGYSLSLGANAYGDGGTSYFIGGYEGTGRFKTYYGVYRCGATGGFSTVGFVYVRGPHPSSGNPLIWYLASSTMYDCLDSKVAPDSVVNGIAEAKSIASTAVTKADASALMAQNLQASLDNTNANISNNYYTKSSTDQAIASASNQLSSSFDTSIKNVGVIKDTRYDNQPPSWYWTNHPQRTAKEFKYSSILGVPQTTVDTLGVLETVVPWADQSGGAIQQRFTWSDSAYALTRYSISASSWSVWVSALNEVKKTVDRKLDASIISNYYTKAEADNVVAGKVEQFSSSVLTSNENLFKANILHVAKAYAPGISSFNYGDYWVIDVNSDNGNWIVLDLGVSSQTMNNNGVYGGPVTVSMDYQMGSGNPEALPNMYFGHGYQSFVHSKKGPHVLYEWYRIYTTFYTGANTLLSNPHLGVGGIAGRIFIRNLKIERGHMTTYSVDVRETTQSVNGIEAIKTVTIDNNGVMSGYGLISELKNGQVTSSFGVNADTFYIGAPSGGKKPFIQRNEWSQINGVPVPPGTYIDTAYIGAATIGIAHLNQATINHLMTGTVETVGSDGARRVISGSVDRLYAPNGTLVLEIGLLS